MLTFLSPGIWQQRHWADEVGAGVYEVRFKPPEAGLYFVFVEVASAGLPLQKSPYVSLTAEAPKPGSGRSAHEAVKIACRLACSALLLACARARHLQAAAAAPGNAERAIDVPDVPVLDQDGKPAPLLHRPGPGQGGGGQLRLHHTAPPSARRWGPTSASCASSWATAPGATCT